MFRAWLSLIFVGPVLQRRLLCHPRRDVPRHRGHRMSGFCFTRACPAWLLPSLQPTGVVARGKELLPAVQHPVPCHLLLLLGELLKVYSSGFEQSDRHKALQRETKAEYSAVKATTKEAAPFAWIYNLLGPSQMHCPASAFNRKVSSWLCIQPSVCPPPSIFFLKPPFSPYAVPKDFCHYIMLLRRVAFF